MNYSFADQMEVWSSPPVDDVGYISSRELLRLKNQELIDMAETFEQNRYGGWRNYENRWRDLFCLDTTYEKNVLDYGCGVGIEALQYAKAGNDVVVADITRNNVRLAMRVLALHGFDAGAFQITEDHLLNFMFAPFDVIHCVGVLHHIPYAVKVMATFHEHLADDGEVRLMLYSDIAYLASKGDFAQAMDGVGAYADWYDTERINERFGHYFKIDRWEYLTKDRYYLGAVLVKA